MKNLVRVLSEDGSVMACALDSTAIVSTLEQLHQTSAVITAALGRLTTAASIMGFMLKGEKSSLTLRIKGGGPAGVLIAVSDSGGNVRSYVENAVVELPLNSYGKLDVKGAVGSNGFLSVAKDLGLKEPYIGQTPIVSGEIAEDITHYYATSEQTPTVCSLGVLVNPDLSVKAAGGYLVQLLPFADTGCIDQIEENVRGIAPISSMLASGLSPLDICELLLKGLSPHVLEDVAVEYRCDCSKQRVERAVLSLGKQDLTELLEGDAPCEVSCHFCNKKYVFSKADLNRMLRNTTNA